MGYVGPYIQQNKRISRSREDFVRNVEMAFYTSEQFLGGSSQRHGNPLLPDELWASKGTFVFKKAIIYY